MNMRFGLLASVGCLVAGCLVNSSVFARDVRPDYKLPLQSYAVIDLSGTVTDGKDVADIALDDDTNLAFAVYTDDENNQPIYRSYEWKYQDPDNPELEATIPMGWQGDLQAEHSIYGDAILLPNAKVGISKWTYGVTGGPGGGGSQLVHSYFVDKNGYVELPPLPAPLTWDYWDCGYGGLQCAVSEQAYAFMGTFSYPVNSTNNHSYCSFIFHNNSYVAFFVGPDVSITNVPIHTEDVIPSTINAKGSGWGYDAISDSTCYFWDEKTKTLSTPFTDTDTPVDLNDQTEVVVKKTSPGEGYLWAKDKTNTSFIDVLPKFVQGQYHNIQPLCISNQVAPAPASPADTTIHVVCEAELKDSASGAKDNLLFSRDNSGAWSAAQIHLPDGMKISNWNTINKKGLIAAIGTTKDNDPQKALLLIPVELIDTKDKVIDTPGVGVLEKNRDVVIEPKKSDDDKNPSSIAWIEPHGSEDTADAPDMPQLVLRFSGTEQMGLKVKWKLKVEYKRPNGRTLNPNEDKIEILMPVVG
jgi:hypothetical protein